MQTKALYLAALGGAFGAFLRAVLSQLIPFQHFQFAWGTFIINMAGCFAIGICIQAIENTALRYFVVVGILGGFTTFSGFGMEVYQYFANNKLTLAATYGIASLIFGTILVYSGIKCYQVFFG